MRVEKAMPSRTGDDEGFEFHLLEVPATAFEFGEIFPIVGYEGFDSPSLGVANEDDVFGGRYGNRVWQWRRLLEESVLPIRVGDAETIVGTGKGVLFSKISEGIDLL